MSPTLQLLCLLLAVFHPSIVDVKASRFGRSLLTNRGCSGLYGQCGGKLWKGPTCCVSGTTCQVQLDSNGKPNEYYSQCLGTPMYQPPTGTGSGPCADLYGQCGGLLWKGPICCKPGYTCQVQLDSQGNKNVYYSQCLQGPGSPVYGTPPTNLSPPPAVYPPIYAHSPPPPPTPPPIAPSVPHPPVPSANVSSPPWVSPPIPSAPPPVGGSKAVKTTLLNPVTGKPETIVVEADGNLAGLVVGIASDSTVKGQVSRLYDLTGASGVTSAKITLPYDASAAGAAASSDLALFAIDPKSSFWVQLPSSVNTRASTVTGTATGLSPVMVANSATLLADLAKLPVTCDNVTDSAALPADVVLVIDSSGSMTTTDPSNLRLKAAKQFVDSMKPTDRVAVVDFDSSAVLLNGLTKDQALIKSSINSIDSSGYTDIGAGVGAAIQELLKGSSTAVARVVILLTDGVGDYDDALTTQMAAAGIRCFTIGLSDAVNAPLLKGIATKTQAAYKLIKDASGLVNIFKDFASVFGDTGADSDGDGVSDCQEVQGVYVARAGEVVTSDPQDDDSDGDGLTDGEELGAVTRGGGSKVWAAVGVSDPRKKDTDGDGLSDPDELALGTSAWATDTDSDGKVDGAP